MAKRTTGWKIYTSKELHLTLLLNVDNFVDFIIYKYGIFERDVLSCIISNASSSSKVLFIDVGAHIGQMSLYVAKNLLNTTVIAFEPEPNTYTQHKAEQLINKLDYMVFQLAASDSYGERKIYVPTEKLPEDYGKFNYGMATLLKEKSSSKSIPKSVNTVPLADFLPKQIDTTIFDKVVVKIDVEGDELNVIKGLIPLLQGEQEIILIIELLFDEFRDDCINVYRILDSKGFKMYTLNLKPIMEIDLSSFSNGNYVFTNH